MKCGCEEQAQVESVTDHGWVPNVTPGAPSWHKMVKHTAVGCKVLTALEVEALREMRAYMVDDARGEPSKIEEGIKYDQGKTRWDLLPFAGLEQVAKVLTFGARKYAPENWRSVQGWHWRYFRAAIGHLVAWQRGEKLDPESGLPHLAHAICCALFLLELDH